MRRVINNKILRHTVAFRLTLTEHDYDPPLGGTTILIMTANSIENQGSDCVQLWSQHGKTFGNVQILGNQFTSWGGTVLRVGTPGPWLTDFIVANNVMHPAPERNQIALEGGKRGLITGNLFKGGHEVVYKGPRVEDVDVLNNKIEVVLRKTTGQSSPKLPGSVPFSVKAGGGGFHYHSSDTHSDCPCLPHNPLRTCYHTAPHERLRDHPSRPKPNTHDTSRQVIILRVGGEPMTNRVPPVTKTATSISSIS